MSELRPSAAEERAEQLMSALRESPAPSLGSEQLLARIHKRVQLGELPDFAPEVLPSSSLRVIWLSLRTKALLLCTIAAGVMTYAFLARSPQHSVAAFPGVEPREQHVGEEVLAPSVTPLEQPARQAPSGETPEGERAAEDATSDVQLAPADHAPSARRGRAQRSRDRTLKMEESGEARREQPPSPSMEREAVTAGESTASGLMELRPHDPRDLEEMRRVADAEQLLASAPSQTLRMVREDNQRFRDGYFHEERRYLEIMALAALGRGDDARLLARLFLRDYGRGPYRARIQRALGL